MINLQTENKLLRYELQEAAETYEGMRRENEALRETISLPEQVIYEKGIIYPVIL